MAIYISNDNPNNKIEVVELLQDGSARTADGSTLTSAQMSTYYEQIDPDAFFVPGGGVTIKTPAQAQSNEIEHSVTESISSKPPERLSSNQVANIRYDIEDDDDEPVVPQRQVQQQPQGHALSHLMSTKPEKKHPQEDPISAFFSKIKRSVKVNIPLAISVNVPKAEQVRIINDMFDGMSLTEYIARETVNEILSDRESLVKNVKDLLEEKIYGKPQSTAVARPKRTKPSARKAATKGKNAKEESSNS